MPVLGIDLGRASCAAFVQFTGDETGDNFGLYLEPIVVLTAKGEWLVGEDARRAAASGSGEAVWDLLALQGRRMSDFSPVQLASWSFRLVPGVAGKALVEFHTRHVSSSSSTTTLPRTVLAPEELLAVLLAHVRQLAEERAGVTIEQAVLTMPTSFHYTQRRAVRDACIMAGLNVRRLVVGSTAASLAHVLARDDQAVGELWVVVDYGAGSVDMSLVSSQRADNGGGTESRSIEVKAVAGDATIGGDVVTDRIMGHFLRDGNIHAAVTTPQSLHRLRRASQLAKKILSTSDAASVQLQIDSGAFAGSITRTQLDAACVDCWRRVDELLRLVLAEGHATSDQVNGVLLCDGSAVLPTVRDVVQRLFPTASLEVNSSVDLQARGAAMLAASLLDTARSPLLLDVTPLAFAVQRFGTKEVAILIPANVRVPAKGGNVFFVGSHVTELGYRVLEGRDLRQAMATGPHAPVATPHCVGTIRPLHAPVVVTKAPKAVVTKLSIAFDLSEDLELTASIALADLAAAQPTTTTFLGDDSILPRDAIARAKAERDRVFGGHRKVDKPLNEAEVCNGAPVTLEEYAGTLRRMVEAKTLAVAISDDDARLLLTKIDELQECVHTPRPTNSNSNSSTSTGDETSEAGDDMSHTNERVLVQLQALRRLHWSVAAAAAIAQLRAEMQ